MKEDQEEFWLPITAEKLYGSDMSKYNDCRMRITFDSPIGLDRSHTITGTYFPFYSRQAGRRAPAIHYGRMSDDFHRFLDGTEGDPKVVKMEIRARRGMVFDKLFVLFNRRKFLDIFSEAQIEFHPISYSIEVSNPRTDRHLTIQNTIKKI